VTDQPQRSKIESDIHDLLDDANLMLLLAVPDKAKGKELAERLRYCADLLEAAGLAESATRLRYCAETIETRLGAA
jgi:hypothetical protein